MRAYLPSMVRICQLRGHIDVGGRAWMQAEKLLRSDAASGKDAAEASGSASTPVIGLRDIRKPLRRARGIEKAFRLRRASMMWWRSSALRDPANQPCCAAPICLRSPDDGEVSFAGEAITWRRSGAKRTPADPAQLRRIRTNLSMVFQQFNLWAHMTVLGECVRSAGDGAWAREGGCGGSGADAAR